MGVEAERGIFGPRWRPAGEPARVESLGVGEDVWVAVAFAHEDPQPPSSGDRVALDHHWALRLSENVFALGEANRLRNHPGRGLVVVAGLTYSVAPLAIVGETVDKPSEEPSDIVS